LRCELAQKPATADKPGKSAKSGLQQGRQPPATNLVPEATMLEKPVDRCL
jgi:hypothetical protein